jgi:hypothetical protein
MLLEEKQAIPVSLTSSLFLIISAVKRVGGGDDVANDPEETADIAVIAEYDEEADETDDEDDSLSFSISINHKKVHLVKKFIRN